MLAIPLIQNSKLENNMYEFDILLIIYVTYLRNGSVRRIRSAWLKSHRQNETRDEHKHLDQINAEQICSYVLKEHLISLQFF